MNRATRLAVMAIAALVTIYVLFTLVFPWVDRQFFANPVLG